MAAEAPRREAAGPARRPWLPFVVVALSLAVAAGVGVSWLMAGADGPALDLSRRTPLPPAPVAARDENKLRFAVATMVSPEATFSAYLNLVQLVGRRAGRHGDIVLRSSYAGVRRALEQKTVDMALVCTGTYLHCREDRSVELLAAPRFADGATYHCVVIANRRISARGIEDLRGREVVLTDPESYTGRWCLESALVSRGLSTGTFFGRVMYSGSHDRSILAVAAGAADAAPVDSLILQPLLKKDAGLKERLRILWESEAYGPPPIVVPVGLDPALKSALRKVVLTLHESEDGARALKAIGIERFQVAREEDYDSAWRCFAGAQKARAGRGP
jgi:phosphonate transport system substrate-binding protein